MAESLNAETAALRLGVWLCEDVVQTEQEMGVAVAVATVLQDRERLLAEVERLTAEPPLITTPEGLRAQPAGTLLFWWNRGPAAPPHVLRVVKGDTLACTDGLWYWIDERDEAARIVRAGRLQVAWRPASAEAVSGE